MFDHVDWVSLVGHMTAIVVAVWLASIRATWKVGDIRDAAFRELASTRRDAFAEIASVRRELADSNRNLREEREELIQKLREEADEFAHNLSETFTAIRTQIGNNMLECERRYINQDGYQKSHDALINAIADLRKEIREDLKAVENKIDGRPQRL